MRFQHASTRRSRLHDGQLHPPDLSPPTRLRGADCIPSIDGISPGADRLLDADETGSTWSVNGVAINGPRKGEQFDPVDVAYVSFWFAWAAFQPETDLWTNNSG